MPEPRSVPIEVSAIASEKEAISLAREVIGRFELTDLQPLLRAVELRAEKQELNLAVFGRFKAGKSSFLNHLIGRTVLPVGVVPVTSVVTEISQGPAEAAVVVFQHDKRSRAISIREIASYISEAENPGNKKGVQIVSVSLPHLQRFGRLKLVDTPGLESVFAQNTEASLSWSPNVDLALVAVSVDAPLAQHDVALVERLQRFTPNVCVLLTKMDTIDVADQAEVLAYVESQLRAWFAGGVPVLPYSIRAGYENLRLRFEQEYLSKAVASFHQERAAAVTRKLQTLLLSAADYLRLSLKAAEARESDLEHLHTQVLSEQSVADQKLRFQLMAKHAAGGTRPEIERHLQETYLAQLQKKLVERLAMAQSGWRGSFAKTLSQLEQWLRSELKAELTDVSIAASAVFLEPLCDLQRQCRNDLQAYRDALSATILSVFGVPLRTTESEIELRPPRSPDISIGKVFDHNWELISALIPMSLVRGALKRHFAGRVEAEVFKNLSRLTSQWEDAIHAAIRATEKEAHDRFAEMVFTVRRLLTNRDLEQNAPTRAFLRQIEMTLENLAARPQEHD
jgi:GTP-binding protein EngB required for normal cell division